MAPKQNKSDKSSKKPKDTEAVQPVELTEEEEEEMRRMFEMLAVSDAEKMSASSNDTLEGYMATVQKKVAGYLEALYHMQTEVKFREKKVKDEEAKLKREQEKKTQEENAMALRAKPINVNISAHHDCGRDASHDFVACEQFATSSEIGNGKGSPDACLAE